MNHENFSPIYGVISGSFRRSKAMIDRDIDVFTARAIEILSPKKGGLMRPRPGTLWTGNAYPLPYELDLNEGQAKKFHHEYIKHADFLYLENEKFDHEEWGYLGSSTWWELITAVVNEKPVFSREKIDPAFADHEPKWLDFIEAVPNLPPEEVANIVNSSSFHASGLYVPGHIAIERAGLRDNFLPYQIAIWKDIPRREK